MSKKILQTIIEKGKAYDLSSAAIASIIVKILKFESDDKLDNHCVLSEEACIVGCDGQRDTCLLCLLNPGTNVTLKMCEQCEFRYIPEPNTCLGYSVDPYYSEERKK